MSIGTKKQKEKQKVQKSLAFCIKILINEVQSGWDMETVYGLYAVWQLIINLYNLPTALWNTLSEKLLGTTKQNEM